MMNLTILRRAGIFYASVLFLLCALSGRDVYGQATTGTISGVVSDGIATVAGAAVTVRNLDINATRNATTDADGRFYFPGLPVGPYEITVDKSGFGKYRQGPVVLVLNQVAVVNVTPNIRRSNWNSLSISTSDTTTASIFLWTSTPAIL